VHRLLLVEGIPGAGKTTTAERLAALLRERGVPAVAHLEGQPNPVDLAWHWWLPGDAFERVLVAHPQAAAELGRCAWVGASGVAVAYTQVDATAAGPTWPALAAELADHEPFDGRLAPEAFVALLATRWTEFGAAAPPGVTVLEAAFLQDTLVELLLWAQWDVGRIEPALGRLVAAVAGLEPIVVRLTATDPGAAVEAAAADRVDERGERWWARSVASYLSGTPWALDRGASGWPAFLAFLAERLAVEDALRGRLPIAWLDLPSPAGTGADWSALDGALARLADGLVAGESLGWSDAFSPGGTAPCAPPARPARR
jgi:hypothetical protein